MFGTKLIQLSTALRHTNISTQRIFAYHASNVGQNQELKTSTEDPLLKALRSPFPTQVLITLENNKDIINGSHILTALVNLTRLYKIDGYDRNKKKNFSWNNDPISKQLYSLIESKLNKITNAESIEILTHLVKLKVSPTTNIMQNILNNIYNNLESLSLNDFGKLSLYMRRLSQTKQLEKIEKKLKHKFLFKLTTEFNEKDITCLVNALSFATYYSDNVKLIKSIIEYIKNYENEISLYNSVRILESLCTMKCCPEECTVLLDQVQNVILQNINLLNAHQINFIIHKLTEKTRHSYVHPYYNPDFMDQLVKQMISKDVGLDSALSVLKCFSYVQHENRDILNYSFATYFENTTISGQKIKDSSGKLLVLITYASMLMHKSIFWTEIEDFLNRNDDILKYNHETSTILTLNLLCLDTYNIQLLDKIIKNNYNYSAEPFLHWTFCRIYQKLQLAKNYKGPTLSESQINALKRLHKEIYFHKGRKWEFLKNIQEGLGGSDYVKYNLASKFFHLIDYVVVFQKDGTPVPINNEPTANDNEICYIEDLKVPLDSQIVAIMIFKQEWYFRNTRNLKGYYKVPPDTLKEMSYKVVYIDRYSLENLQEDEKTAFFMNQIKLALT